MQLIFKKILIAALISVPLTGHTMLVDDTHLPPAGANWVESQSDLFVAQGGGMTLSEAVASVKSRGNVKQVISAKTESSGGRETHVIKVLTTDGKVKTHRIPGKRR